MGETKNEKGRKKEAEWYNKNNEKKIKFGNKNNELRIQFYFFGKGEFGKIWKWKKVIYFFLPRFEKFGFCSDLKRISTNIL